MEVISSVSSLGVSVRGYDDGVLAELLREQHPDKIFLAEVAPEAFEKTHPDFESYKSINEIVKSQLMPVGIDMERYDNFKNSFIQENLKTPELAIKKNMLDLIDNTILNYLAQYWKGPETINSEVTDSLFRAKHKLFSSVFYDLEAEFWEKRNKKILDNIKKEGATNSSVIISSVESRYWFKDHLSYLFR